MQNLPFLIHFEQILEMLNEEMWNMGILIQDELAFEAWMFVIKDQNLMVHMLIFL